MAATTDSSVVGNAKFLLGPSLFLSKVIVIRIPHNTTAHMRTVPEEEFVLKRVGVCVYS